MKKQILKLSMLGLMLLFLNTAYGIDENKKPVDEALEYTPKEDTIKGGDKLTDSYNDEKISLSNIDKNYIIERKDLNFPPYKCFIYHLDGTETEIGTINDSKINFKIKKSLLSVGDIILVTNLLDVTDKKNPFKKFIIEEVEIVE